VLGPRPVAHPGLQVGGLLGDVRGQVLVSVLGDDHVATRFLEMLRDAVEAEESPLLVLGTMRSDYLGTLQRSAPFRGLGFKTISVGPMSKEGMREIVEEPARLGQIELEKGLTDLLLEDTETADALPLLAFTMRMMWDRFHDKRLFEVGEYKSFGRLQGAIAQAADETFKSVLERVPAGQARADLGVELLDAFREIADDPRASAAGSRCTGRDAPVPLRSPGA